MTTDTQMLNSAPAATAVVADEPVWHTQPASVALAHWATPADGLTSEMVARRREEWGRNELEERGARSALSILWEQLTNPLVLLLIGAAVLSGILGKADNVIAISAIVVLNAVLGLVQEYRAERAIHALQKMAAPAVIARRGGRVQEVASGDLVPGDLILLEAGSIVPADARLVEAINVRAQEAALTGESQAVDKESDAIAEPNAPLGDRHNMVYMGTSITYGRATAVVVNTGMRTELGRIANLIQSITSIKTPLQRRMDELGRVLLVVALAVMGLAFIIGWLNGEALDEVLLNAVAIAVAVVPEGLPAVVTIALALGAQRMLRRKALIRKLPAVETLGSVDVICSDKTGTLTENRMTVTYLDVADDHQTLDAAAQNGLAILLNPDGTQAPISQMAQATILVGGALCNDSRYDHGTWIGDPTETALTVAAERWGLDAYQTQTLWKRVAEAPFDSDRKRMTTVHAVPSAEHSQQAEVKAVRHLLKDDTTHIAFSKGAVVSVLSASTAAWLEGSVQPLTDALRQRILAADDQMAKEGLRVLGVAYRLLDQAPATTRALDLEEELIFVGMVGIIDPPRLEVKDAVATCRIAGVRPVMITGDHPLTARAIAVELGIAKPDDPVLTGPDLDKLTPDQLSQEVQRVSVYARVSPQHKLEIVRAVQGHGHIAAMTGDGVNDAPALKQADIGVAMGITGTAVSKEASDMVILDDNFATIVSAVSEGRTLYDNMRRFIKYLLASNTGELLVLLVTQMISGMTLPLTTLQILWMNLTTDGIPALALGVEQPERGAMERAPYGAQEKLFGRGLPRHILIVGSVMGITGVALGYFTWSNNWLAADGGPAWNSMVFIFLTIAQMGHALALRSHRESFFSLGLSGNRFLWLAVIGTIALQLMAIYLPVFNDIFNTHPLTMGQLAICLGLSSVVFIVVELEKIAIRRFGWPG